MQQNPQPDLGELWIKHQRKNNKTTVSHACIHCLDRQIFLSADDLWNHAQSDHGEKFPADKDERERARRAYLDKSAEKRPTATAKDDLQPRKPSYHQASRAQAEPPPPSKRPLSAQQPTRSISGLQALDIGGSPRENEDVTMDEVPAPDKPRKRAAIGDGISAGSASPARVPESRDSSQSPPPRRSKARPISAPYGSSSDFGSRRQDTHRPHVSSKKLWNPDLDSPMPRASFDPSNIASAQAQKSRAPGLQSKSKKPFYQHGQPASPRIAPPPQSTPSAIYGSKAASAQNPNSTSTTKPIEEPYDIMLEPETRPISQEQLVAEVKGIYAGLVMVEAKCIEVDNKQAALAQTEGSQAKLNNEQWQALIALHRTLLHEHHDFFLASQHPSASPALRRLASKYAMPARMWRHGIHSFLELLRHRLPASLDHMLAFIYLAYSMMALLYETVPAFEDTWIECLGDLGRYRMAIEDDDIKDREVWTGVARHWYSKASDKAPTTGRLYHHLAILARPNALQQLFYYSKSLCVVIPFVSARESILTLFEPVLNAEKGQGQFRLPPLENAFIKAHGLLFKNQHIGEFDPASEEFLNLLDNQIGRVTRKFMEQGYYIAVANNVAMLAFASKENILMRAMANPGPDEADTPMDGNEIDESSSSMQSFQHAQRLANATLEIVLQRIGDPNVLPFIHVTLVFMYHMSRYPRAIRLLEAQFPWHSLAVMLNTLLTPMVSSSRIQDSKFPLPEKDDVRPFTEDFAMRGLLWADGYYPDQWFINEKIDDEEKYLEVASMTDDRKERILWLACRLASSKALLVYDSDARCFSVPTSESSQLPSRSSTFASATTIGHDVERSETLQSADAEDLSDAEEYVESTTMSPEPL